MSQSDNPDGLTEAQRAEIRELIREEQADSAPITRRDALKGGGLLAGLAALGGGATGSAAADLGDGGGEALAVGSATANTYRITDNRYGGADSAKSELVGELDGDDAGAKFSAEDTGALYHWDGSGWVLMPAERESINTDKIANVADHVVGTTSDLEAAFNNLSAGEHIHIGPEEAPYRTTQWLDIDVNGVTVTGYLAGGSGSEAAVGELIKPADGADVGGIRIGTNSAAKNVTVQGIAYHGNESAMDDTVKRLHGIIVGVDAENVLLRDNHITKTHPYHEHGSGGSGISVRSGALGVQIRGNYCYDIGDRGIQCAGKDCVIDGNVLEAGFDRPVSLDVTQPNGNRYGAITATVSNNVAYQAGSVVGCGIVAVTFQNAPVGNYAIHGNVGRGAHGRLVKISNKDIHNVAITGNVGQSTGSNQVALIEEASRVSVVGNVGEDYTEGVKVRNTSEVIVANNYLKTFSGSGILLEDADDTIVMGNTVDDASAEGIFVKTDDGTCQNFAIGENLVKNSKTGISLFEVGNAISKGFITHNFVRSNDQAGIDVVDGTQITTQGNIVDTNSQGSVGSYDAISINDNKQIVMANQVVGSDHRDGIRVTAGADDVRLANNKIDVAAVSTKRSLNGTKIIVGGEAEESANAETPQGSYPPGTVVRFTDSGDGSGNGTYLIDRAGVAVQLSSNN